MDGTTLVELAKLVLASYGPGGGLLLAGVLTGWALRGKRRDPVSDDAPGPRLVRGVEAAAAPRPKDDPAAAELQLIRKEVTAQKRTLEAALKGFGDRMDTLTEGFEQLVENQTVDPITGQPAGSFPFVPWLEWEKRVGELQDMVEGLGEQVDAINRRGGAA